MNLKRLLVFGSATLLVVGAGGAVGGWYGLRAHARIHSGRKELGYVSCDHCHQKRLEQMPWAKARPHHAGPAGIAVSPDGTRLYIALDDTNEIAEADAQTLAVLRRARVDGGPFGVAIDGTGTRLFVACRHQDRLAVVAIQDLKEQGSLSVGIRPTDVVFCGTPAGERIFVTNSGSNDISVLALSPLREIVRSDAGREPYAAACSPDGTRIYVANRIATHEEMLSLPASEITVLDAATGRIVSRELLDSAHMAEGIATVPTRRWVLSTLIKVRNLVPITQVKDGWVMSTGLAVSAPDGSVTQIPLDEANAYFSDPSGVVATPDGKRAFVASGGSNTVTAIDLDRLSEWLAQAGAEERADAIRDMALSYRYVTARIPTHSNPRRLAMSPDGRTLFVAERLADSVLALDTATLKPRGRVTLGDGGDADPVRQGERVFTAAKYTFQGQFACRSCHPDGHVDGLAYDFDGSGVGDNLLDNRSLCGVAGTEPFKWNGKNPTLQFQDGPRFARVLMRTDPIPTPQLDELAQFIVHLPPERATPQAHVGQPLTPAEERGRKLFFAKQRPDGTAIPVRLQCQSCHTPPLFTNRLKASVGTEMPRDPKDGFDTPHLLGIGASAPYLHDGRAKSLEELWTTYQKDDQHGVSSYWSKEQLNDLVEYLKTL